MIRVNLLAKKASKKKAGAIQHLAIGAAAVVILALILGWVWVDQRGKLTTLRSQIATRELRVSFTLQSLHAGTRFPLLERPPRMRGTR